MEETTNVHRTPSAGDILSAALRHLPIQAQTVKLAPTRNAPSSPSSAFPVTFKARRPRTSARRFLTGFGETGGALVSAKVRHHHEQQDFRLEEGGRL